MQWTTTYSGLTTAMEEYVEDDSTEFASQQQNCINRAEERLYKDLDMAAFNASASTTASNGSTSTLKPNVNAPALSVHFTAANDHATRKTFDFIQLYGGSGRPLYFFEDKDRLWWAPTPDADYAIVVRSSVRPTPLSASNTTNWFTSHVADLLLWASLIEAEAFLIAPERVAEFQAYYAANLGPARAYWRDMAQRQYEPVEQTPEPERTR